MRTVLVWLLKAYRMVISPLYGQVCRYHPSCSAYALEAVQVHGAARGSWLAVRRLVRCHPWTPGGFDPVPPPDGGTAHGGVANGGIANGGSTEGPEARSQQEPGEDADGDLDGDLDGDAAWQPDAELPGPPAYAPSSPGATRAAPVPRSAAEESAPGLSPPSSSAPSTATSRGARA